MPKHILLGLEIVGIWLPLLFHAVYGLFIIGRGKSNYLSEKYKWSQNRMYMLQRWSGIVIFFFLIYHISTTTGAKYAQGAETIYYDAMQAKLTANGYFFFFVYLVGILASAYHLSYGIWNFCIRWGITISEKAQERVQKFSLAFFVLVTLLGWAALTGFLLHKPSGSGHSVLNSSEALRYSVPM
jgi:succinate dehydrogenase / fumarate reductase cytochrome b subunit